MLSAFPKFSIDLSDLSLFSHLVPLTWILAYSQCRSEFYVKSWRKTGFFRFGDQVKRWYVKSCVGSPQDYTEFQWLARKIHRTWHLAVLSATIYYREKIQIKTTKGKGTWAVSGGKQVQASKNPPLMESGWLRLIFPATSCDNVCEMSHTKEVLPVA